MGLRCSLFGHAYGEPVTERDRERRGDEAVVTVREVRRCSRCGAESVLSENTEVRHLETDSSSAETSQTGDTSPASAGAGATATDEDSATEDGSVDVAELVEDAETDAGPEPSRTREPAAASGGAEATDVTTETGETATGTGDEDAVIIKEGPDDADVDSETPTRAEPETPTGAEPETPTGAEPETPTGAEPETPTRAEPETPTRAEPETPTGADGDPATEPETTAAEEPDAHPRSAEEPDAQPQADGPEDAEVASTGTGDDEQARFGESAPDDTAEFVGGDQSTPAEPNREPATEAPGADEEPTSEPETDARGLDAVDDIDAEVEPATEETAEPETMFGTADAEETDPWKERSDSEGEDRGEWDDPAFQFAEAERGGPERGPTGITAEGTLDVDRAVESSDRGLVCPECGFTKGPGSSLRAGDICPECHRGYLAGSE
ncbi:MAG: DUF7093 family protein [Halodesulfurarchaeum sp.]